jgi:hypothetical protein
MGQAQGISIISPISIGIWEGCKNKLIVEKYLYLERSL